MSPTPPTPVVVDLAELEKVRFGPVRISIAQRDALVAALREYVTCAALEAATDEGDIAGWRKRVPRLLIQHGITDSATDAGEP